ncbi:MAG: hypothetical protein ACREFX_07970 [Opitutaceae bacterium]
MKQFAVVALVTAVGFVAGLFAGIYFESHRPLPPPPVPFGAEFRHRGAARRWSGRIDRAQLIARIREIQPQLEAFRRQLGEIDAQFSRDFDAVLNPEQRSEHAEQVRRHLSHRPPSTGRPLTDDQISFMLRDESAHTVLWDVVIPLRLDLLTREYKLTEAQQTQVRELLKQRRERFLALVDRSPPPSVWLSRLAPMVERLAK